MKLSTILRQAKSGELSNIAARNNDELIVDYINLGLIALYSRFLLKVEEALIELQDGKTLYHLDGTDGALVTVNGDPLTDDSVVTILDAYDEGGRVPLNEIDDERSIFTPTYNSIQIPVTGDGAFVSAIYQAHPEEIVFEDAGEGVATEKIVQLPKQLLEPLLHYIGYRAHGSMDSSVQADAQTHYQKFLFSCNEAVKLGLVEVDNLSTRPVTRGGWV